jgi:hypothetical protein
VRLWAEAALGRRQLARSVRRLVAEGYAIRDVLVDGDSVQHSDRLIVGPSGVYLVGFRTLPGNVWRGDRSETAADVLAAHAGSTHRLADVVSATLREPLDRLHVRVYPLLTVIGAEQAPGARIAGVPLLGPIGLADHVMKPRPVLSAMQTASLVDRIDDWLALRSVTGLHSRTGRRTSARGRGGSL